MATLTGATVVALTIPSVAQADPEPSPVPAPPPPSGNTFLQGPPADPNAPPPPAAPAPPPPVDPNAPPPPPGRTRARTRARRSQCAAAGCGRSQRSATAAGTGARPCRQRCGRLQLRGARRLESLRRHAVVLRPGAADQGTARRHPADPTRTAGRAARERHQCSAGQAGHEAVRRSRGRQRQGGHAAGLRYGRVLHAVPRHPGQSGERPARQRRHARRRSPGTT